MRYTSTRADLAVDFASVVASGLAGDGGLYLPERFPAFDARRRAALARADYGTVLATVGAAFANEALTDAQWRRIADQTVAAFRHKAVAPLSEIGESHFLLELFHGPTLSFKDYGLQALSRLLGQLNRSEGRPLFILGATSGDTGSAAIEAFRGQAGARIVILHPHGRVSDIQRRQMTTVADENVLNIAIEGSFDDCQRLAKSLLKERAAKNEEAVLSVNSINWGRLLFQTAYYVHLGCRLEGLGRPLALSVPSGNFGNALSAIIATHMGVPFKHLMVATNANDALSQIFTEGRAKAGAVRHTLSPAMDIQIPSNLERLLYLVNDRDAARTAAQMQGVARGEALEIAPGWRDRLPLSLEAVSIGDQEIIETMRRVYAETDRIIDPHSAVAVAGAERARDRPEGALTVSVATAHPAKFGDAVETALGFAPRLPAALDGLMEREERFVRCPPDLAALRTAIG